MKLVLVLFLALLAGIPAAQAAEKPLKMRVSAAGGYDNNRDLNAARRGDYFAQETFSAAYTRLLDRKAQLRLYYNALNLNYFDATDLNLLLNELGAGFNYALTSSAVWENSYAFQYLYFPNNEAVTSYEHELRTGIRQRMTDRWTLRAGVVHSGREYEDKKSRGPDRVDRDAERADDRNTLELSSSYKAKKNLLLNGGVSFYRNDSNEQYKDYYDYDAYVLSTGFAWKIDEDWTAFGKFAFERRGYELRPVRDNEANEQEDTLYTTTLSLYRRISKDLSLGSTLSYREKKSNEPSQRYSGSIGTLGLYYSF